MGPISAELDSSAKSHSPRLDTLANTIASATFEVINEAKVRTADMGGKTLFFCGQVSRLTRMFLGSATTSDFTSAIIQKI